MDDECPLSGEYSMVQESVDDKSPTRREVVLLLWKVWLEEGRN